MLKISKASKGSNITLSKPDLWFFTEEDQVIFLEWMKENKPELCKKVFG